MISPFFDHINNVKWCAHGYELGKGEQCYNEHSAHALEVMDCGNAVGRTPEVLPCTPDPRAPHGVDRNGSHNAGRYACECEGWEPEDSIDDYRVNMAGCLE